MMKILVLPLGLLLLSGTALAAQEDRPLDPSSQDAQRTPRNPASLDEQQRKGTLDGKQMSAEVVSVDSQAKTITVTKTAALTTPGSPGSPEHSLPGTAAETKTLTVEGGAVASLPTIHKGDKVMLTCRSSASSSSTTAPTGAAPMGTSSDDCAAVTAISKSR